VDVDERSAEQQGAMDPGAHTGLAPARGEDAVVGVLSAVGSFQ